MHATHPSPASPATIPADPVATTAAGPTCCICGQQVGAWVPHAQRALRSEFMKLMETVGSDLSVYQCPSCQCNDRDRHLWLYMNAVGIPADLPGARVLHIAPERHLELLISAHHPAVYVRGDLHPRPGHVALDVEALDCADESFDLVICNHVLEHVADPQRALAEFHRCLVPGGLLIAQTPYSAKLKHTLELNTPVSPEFARLFYGQDDHVRLFGIDLFGAFNAAGFKGMPLEHHHLLPDADPALCGCNAREPFFAFHK
jgi:SAM-dependent methyltransferase